MSFEDIREFFWPVLVELNSEEIRQDQEKLDNDILIIKNTDWTNESELALDEAKKLNELENQRRVGAESKAAIYLTAITALAPVLVSLVPGIISSGGNNAFVDFLSFAIFVYALSNLLRAALWAFNTLKVSASNRIDTIDLVRIWGGAGDAYKKNLIVENICAVRKNRDGVNRKVTCIKMTHELLLRTFLAFVLLLLLQTSMSFIPNISIANQVSSTTCNDKQDIVQHPVNIYRI